MAYLLLSYHHDHGLWQEEILLTCIFRVFQFNMPMKPWQDSSVHVSVNMRQAVHIVTNQGTQIMRAYPYLPALYPRCSTAFQLATLAGSQTLKTWSCGGTFQIQSIILGLETFWAGPGFSYLHGGKTWKRILTWIQNILDLMYSTILQWKRGLTATSHKQGDLMLSTQGTGAQGV